MSPGGSSAGRLQCHGAPRCPDKRARLRQARCGCSPVTAPAPALPQTLPAPSHLARALPTPSNASCICKTHEDRGWLHAQGLCLHRAAQPVLQRSRTGGTSRGEGGVVRGPASTERPDLKPLLQGQSLTWRDRGMRGPPQTQTSQGSAGNSAVYWVLRLSGVELHRNPVPTGGVAGEQQWLPGPVAAWTDGLGPGSTEQSRAPAVVLHTGVCTRPLLLPALILPQQPTGKGQSRPQGETPQVRGRAGQSREHGWGNAATGRAPHGPLEQPPAPAKPAPPRSSSNGHSRQ